jgi:diguanylate cyclase (GGDEF)-like protein/PAS domain S-box-containing protein
MRNVLSTEARELALGADAVDGRTHVRRALATAETLHFVERMAHVGSYDFDAATDRWTWSDELCRIIGYNGGGEPDENAYLERTHPDEWETVRAALHVALRRGIPFRIEHRIIADDGTQRWVELSGQPVRDAGGAVTRLLGTAADVTTQKRFEQQLAFVAHHDPLTGLPNRGLLVRKLARAIDEAGSDGRHVAIIFVGLDGVKRINDAWGRHEGDRVIRKCAERLVACARLDDIVARVGGVHFVVLLSDLTSGAVAAGAAERLRAALAEPIPLGNGTLGMRAGFGISCFPDDGAAPEQLIGYADLAMHHAKQTRRGEVARFEPVLQESATGRLRLERELADAIRAGDLVVHYQPIVDARTGKVEGVEALVRWQHPVDGLKDPASFIPLAEETGLIVPLGEFVLREASRTVAEIHRSGFSSLRLAVNLSLRQLDDDAVLGLIRSALEESRMPARLLDLEITESFLVTDSSRTIGLLGELSRLGIRIALDDFGTGYSALAFLQQFPVDQLKLDRTFVTEIEHNARSRAIAAAIVELAHRLDMRTVAEGVETRAQRSALDALGCDALQGFLFGGPMPAHDLKEYLKAAR